MKKNFWIFAVALVCLAAACNKIEQNEIPVSGPVKVTYILADGNENVSKASIDGTDAHFSWNTADQIAVYTTTGGYKISDQLEDTYNGTNAATYAFSGAESVDESDRANFAVFPAGLVYDALNNRYSTDVTASSLKLNLPASYLLSQVQGDASPVPMIADNAPNGVLAFKSLTALLRIDVVNVPKQTRRIEFDFNGKKVQGEFTLTGVVPGTSVIETGDTSEPDDIVTILTPDVSAFTASLTVNIPVPVGTYGDVTITAYDAASGGHAVLKLTRPIKTDVAWTPGRKDARKITATLPVFSVSASKKVTFAPGNLQATYDGSSWSWDFAAHQYDLIGNGAANSLVTTSSPYVSGNGTVDLFCWVGASGTLTDGVSAYGIYRGSYSEKDKFGTVIGESLMNDWGHNTIGTYDPDIWRTPTGGTKAASWVDSEWYYVFMTRSAASSGLPDGDGSATARYVKATVCSKKGIIIFPDAYTHPAGVTVTGTPIYNSKGSACDVFVVADDADWQKMEAAGAVFLPIAGNRSSSISLSYGWYWTSTSEHASISDVASYLKIGEDSETTDFRGNGQGRYSAQSVRLVRDLN